MSGDAPRKMCFPSSNLRLNIRSMNGEAKLKPLQVPQGFFRKGVNQKMKISIFVYPFILVMTHHHGLLFIGGVDFGRDDILVGFLP